MTKNIKSLSAILVMALIIVTLHYSGYIPYNAYVSKQIEAFNAIGNKTPSYGTIRPQVVDGFSETPIEGAVVVIPETGKRYKTDSQGYTPAIQVPIIEDIHFKDIYAKPWGEITLIAYKEGYVEYVLFHTQIWKDRTRKGPKILLFKEQEGKNNDPMPIIESPSQLWVNQLVNKFKK